MTTGMTASEIYVMLREMRSAIDGRWILNIYQLNGILLFKISQDSPNKIWILIEPGRRMHLTSITYEREAKQRAFCKALRQHLRDHKITAINQHDFDRVIYFRAGPTDKQYTLVVELFGGGNAILLDPNNRIVSAMTYKRMRDRNIVRGAPFQFPPLRAQDPRSISEEELEATITESSHDIIRTLVRHYNFSGNTVEEILANVNIDPQTPSQELPLKQRRDLHKGIIHYFETLASGTLSPHVILDKEEHPLHVLPLASPRYRQEPKKEYATFNEALDAFYTVHRGEERIDHLEEQFQREQKKLQRLLEKQQQHLETITNQAKQSRGAADAIYHQLPLVEDLLSTIRHARQQDKDWLEIQKRLSIGKEKQIPAATIFNRLDPHTGQLHIELGEQTINLDIRLSAAENANQLYKRGKQLEKKIAGAKIAIEDTRQKITQLHHKREDILAEARSKTPVKRRKKRWYEKYRWFKTSHGLLVLGGRDAVSNQQLVRKHLKDNDLFFHADVLGAPVVIVKAGEADVTQEDLQETGIFAVSYSRAWKAGRSASDAYWVKKDQVSLSAPSGEYLPKGGVMVRGDRNYLRNLSLRLAIGLLEENDLPFLAAGPESAIQSQTKLFAILQPGKLRISETAKRLRKHFVEVAPEKHKKYIQAINIDEIIAILPPGPAAIEEQDK